MSEIRFRFVVLLENYLEQLDLNHGPLFHKWLPDGKNDSIVLDTDDPDVKLSVWFERFGVTSDNKISFDYSRREVDPTIIPTQAVLDSGPLFGLLEMQSLSEEETICLKQNKVGSPAYAKLGRRLVKKIIYSQIHKLIELLRTNYGQYWLANLKDWDSRKESLGSYCQSLQLEYSFDNGSTWNKFMPDKSVARFEGTINKDFSGYLTAKDWKEVEETLKKRYDPSLAGQILIRAQQFADQDNLKYAFIEGVSAFEVAISEYIKRNLHNNSVLFNELSSFWKLPRRTQLISAAGLSDKIPTEYIEKAAEAIKIRNELVHKGSEPPPDALVKLHALFNVTATLISGPKFRFLSANPGNAWEKKANNQPVVANT